MPVRLLKTHLINTSSIAEKFLAITMPFVNKKVADNLKIHAEGTETIFDFIPRDMLPIECGGNGESLETTRKIILDAVDAQR